jgi:hypothetical protein
MPVDIPVTIMDLVYPKAVRSLEKSLANSNSRQTFLKSALRFLQQVSVKQTQANILIAPPFTRRLCLAMVHQQTSSTFNAICGEEILRPNTPSSIVRHSDYQSTTFTTYKMNFNTSLGVIVAPQLGGSLTLSGRDSKFHVTDYDIGGTTVLYSTAEIFTWKKFDKKTVLIVYGGPGEQHELAIKTTSTAKHVEGSGVIIKSTNGTTILNWKVSSTRQVTQIGNVLVYTLDRNTAYSLWTPDFVRTDQWGA